MSMKCIKCGAVAHCYDSRPRKDFTTWRRYYCLKKRCAARWSTYEVVVNETGKMRSGSRSLLEQRDRKMVAANIAQLAKQLSGAEKNGAKK